MMMQLNPPIPLDTAKGKGFAHMVIDYSQEHDLIWAVFLDESGECWLFRNSEVRMQRNFTLGRTGQSSAIVNRLLGNGVHTPAPSNGVNGHA
jgi:hypothetical protein